MLPTHNYVGLAKDRALVAEKHNGARRQITCHQIRNKEHEKPVDHFTVARVYIHKDKDCLDFDDGWVKSDHASNDS